MSNNLSSYEQLMQLLSDRYSCRLYADRAVSRADLERVLEAGRIAPSACNRQPWQFLVVEGGKLRDAILASYDREWIRTAPQFIIVCGDHSQAWHRPFDGKDHTDVDISITTEHLCLAATSLGLATCWVCNFDPAVIRAALALPAEIEPIVILPIGYPAEGSEAPQKRRKPLEEITVWGEK